MAMIRRSSSNHTHAGTGPAGQTKTITLCELCLSGHAVIILCAQRLACSRTACVSAAPLLPAARIGSFVASPQEFNCTARASSVTRLSLVSHPFQRIDTCASSGFSQGPERGGFGPPLRDLVIRHRRVKWCRWHRLWSKAELGEARVVCAPALGFGNMS